MKNFAPKIVLCLVLLMTALSCQKAHAALRTVTNLNNDGLGSLRERIAASDVGDSINFAVTGTLTPDSELVIERDLTIIGPANGALSLSGNNLHRVLNITAGTVRISNLTITNGKFQGVSGYPSGYGGAPGIGGGVLNQGTLFLTNCRFSANSAIGGDDPIRGPQGEPGGAGSGGAIANRAALSLIGCVFSNNVAQGGNGGYGSTDGTGRHGYDGGAGGTGAGGAIDSRGTLLISNCLFQNNVAVGGAGGGATSSGRLSNGVPGADGFANGGAINNNSTMTATGSTWSGNQAISGGALFTYGNTAVSNLTNCTVSDNVATANGGGLITGGDASVVLNSCTIAGNITTAANGSGGGIFLFDAGTTTTLRNTLLATNRAPSGPDAIGALTSNGYNLLGKIDGSSGFTNGLNNDRVGTAAAPAKPEFDPLGLKNNSGPTPTLALQSISPAINAGSPDAPAKDQRGYNRSGRSDIGAFEFNGTPPDTIAPTIAIAVPTNNAIVATLPSISGTASDNTGVVRVDLYLQRKSDNKFWNGSAWTSSTPISTVLNGFGPRRWSRNSGLPAGANLVSGAYFVAARAYDAAGNGTSATRNFYVDTVAPAITIAVPANNAVLKTLPAISGTASDNTGIVRVDLYLQRKSDNKFWNGSVWTTSTSISTVLSGAAPRQWTRNSGLPAGANLTSGLYFVAARAYDASNNGTSATRNFTVDTVAPTISISSPAIGSTVSSFASASGTTSDIGTSGVVRVEFFLRRNADSKWWNGSAWVAAGVPLATSLAPISGGQSWSISGLLPKGANLLDGSYLIGATAFDRAGNSRNVNGNFTLSRPPSEAAASNVQLSSAIAKSDGTIKLTFTGALGASAMESSNYSVTQNGAPVEVQSVQQANSSEVVLSGDALTSGARISVNYNIEDAHGRSITGAANVVVK